MSTPTFETNADLALVDIEVDGRVHQVKSGQNLAVALLDAGLNGLRRDQEGNARGLLCAMGVCFECRVEIDGSGEQRACMTRCRPGMVVSTQALSGARAPTCPTETPPVSVEQYDVVVVGGGPAGVAAARAAAKHGARVLVIDENPALGGQIWRQGAALRAAPELRPHLARLAAGGVTILTGAQVIDGPQSRHLIVSTASGIRSIRAMSIVLATGARERFIPFPGWTMPGVVGVGGLQALLAEGLAIAGRRVVVAGSGPLLAVLVDRLVARGAHVCALVESTPRSRIVGLVPALLSRPGLAVQGLGLLARSLRVRRYWGARVCSVQLQPADHDARLLVEIAIGDRRETIPCDKLACAHGLVPGTELAALLGCALDGRGAVLVDESMATAVPGIFAAGEVTGVAGKASALIEGAIAGRSAARAGGPGWWARARLRKARRWQRALDRCFALAPELASLPQQSTVVCRCEDVRWSELARCTDARSARLYTRCGMGACQGRICGPALQVLRSWTPSPPRAPLGPVNCGNWPPALPDSDPDKSAP